MKTRDEIIKAARLQALQSRDDEISRLRLGLKMIVTQEYDAGYEAEDFAQAVLDGDEPVSTLKTAEGKVT